MIIDKINKLTRRLYPTGRAWNLPLDSFFRNLHEGLAVSESDAYSSALGLLDQILPDNDNFTEEDAVAWELKLQIPINVSLTLEERKTAITRKMAYPGTIRARQSALSVERELRNAGFDVYVHENSIPLRPGIQLVRYAESVTYGNKTMGGVSQFLPVTGVVINSLDQADDDAGIPTDIELRSTFFIGGQTFPNLATVDASREREFRNLILTLKPLHTFGFLLITYV